MKIFPALAVIFPLLILPGTSEAQIRTGFRISPGLGYISSNSLDSYIQSLNDPGSGAPAGSYDAASRLRSFLGVGGFMEYKLSENFYAEAEPSFVYSNNKILINYSRDNVDGAGNGSVERVSSDARIKISYISLPLTGKFRFLHRKELSVFAGLNLNLYFTPKIKSTEEQVFTEFTDGIVLTNTMNKITAEAKADGFRTFGAQFTIGVSKVFNPYGRNFILDLRYSHPLTRSPFYTSNSLFAENSLNNAVFHKETQDQIKSAHPQFEFNDFKVGVFSFTISYTIYKNYR